MREYDDYDDQSIRLYTPILQRVIILAAVVIAVPVVMWTITTFVRSYVARPRVPALEHLASTNTLSRIPVIAPPPPGATPSAVDQSASLEVAAPSDAAKGASGSNKGTANLASLPDTSPSPGANSSAASLQAAPAPSPAIAAATATSDAATINPAAAPVASLPRSVQGASQASSQGASPAPPQMPRSTDNAALSSGASDRGIAWPNPNTTSPPEFGGPRLSLPPAAPPSPPARSAAAEVVAPDEPLRGPVPLPRHRPNMLAMSASASGPATSGPVPLPRARPSDAPAEAANPAIEPAYPPDTNRF